MSEWKKFVVEDLIRNNIISVGDGYRAKNLELGASGIPFARAGNIDNGFDFRKADFFPVENLYKVGNKISKAGDIVFTSKGTVGRFAFVTQEAQEFVYSPQLCYWRSHDTSTLNPRYLYYWMHSREFLDQVHSVKGQTDMADYVSLYDQRKMKISIPPIEHQLETASILSSLDDKIDLLHRQNKTLESMAETLFRQWFVEEAEESWEVGKLGDVLSVKGGTTPSTAVPEFWDGNMNWTTPKDLSNHQGIYMFRTERKITELGLSKIGSGQLPIGTVLLSSRAPIGYLAINEIPVAINQGYIAILCNKGLSNYFVYSWCKANLEEIKNSGNGSVFQEISKTTFKELPIIIPPFYKLEEFDIAIEPVFQKIKNNQIQLESLTQMRDTLLPKLMTGELILS